MLLYFVQRIVPEEIRPEQQLGGFSRVAYFSCRYARFLALLRQTPSSCHTRFFIPLGVLLPPERYKQQAACKSSGPNTGKAAGFAYPAIKGLPPAETQHQACGYPGIPEQLLAQDQKIFLL